MNNIQCVYLVMMWFGFGWRRQVWLDKWCVMMMTMMMIWCVAIQYTLCDDEDGTFCGGKLACVHFSLQKNVFKYVYMCDCIAF